MEQELKPEEISKIYNGLPETDFKNILSASMLNQMNFYIRHIKNALESFAPNDLEETTVFEDEILGEGENV